MKECCETCEHYRDYCQDKYKKEKDSEVCPDHELNICGSCVRFESCKQERGITKLTPACIDFKKGTSTASTLEIYITDVILPALKNRSRLEDISVLKKIEYSIKKLMEVIGKHDSKEINRDQIFTEILVDDFEISNDLQKAILSVSTLLKTHGTGIEIDISKLEDIGNKVTEIRMIQKMCWACGISINYTDIIIKTVIEDKFGKRITLPPPFKKGV